MIINNKVCYFTNKTSALHNTNNVSMPDNYRRQITPAAFFTYQNTVSNIKKAGLSFRGSLPKAAENLSNTLVQNFQTMQKLHPEFSIEKAIQSAMPDTKITSELLQNVETIIFDFLKGNIDHRVMQIKFEQAGIPMVKAGAEGIEALFDNLFSKMQGTKPKSPSNHTGAIYRCITKPEYDKLIEGKQIDASNCFFFSVTQDPIMDFHPFARVKFKPRYDIKDISLFSQQKGSSYILMKPQYSLDDIDFIDRILPNSYLEVFKAKSDALHPIKGTALTLEMLEQKTKAAQSALVQNFQRMQEEHPEITVKNVLEECYWFKTFTDEEVSKIKSEIESFLNGEIHHMELQTRLMKFGCNNTNDDFFNKLFSLMPNFKPSPRIIQKQKQEPVKRILKDFMYDIDKHLRFDYHKDISQYRFAQAFEESVLKGEIDPDTLYQIVQKKYLSMPDNQRRFFTGLFSKIPNYKPTPEPENTTIYRHISKREYDRLLKEFQIQRLKDYEGGSGWCIAIDVTTNPELNIHYFARVTFNDNYTKYSPSILEHKPESNYYHLNKDSYSLLDIKSIERKLPNGFLEVYHA